MKQNKVVASLVAVLFCLLLGGLICYAEGDIKVGDELLTREDLQDRVDKLLKSGNVMLRRDVDSAFTLGRIYEEEGNSDEAIKLYDEALRVNAWNLEYQLRLAKLLKFTERKNEAAEKAQLVYDYAEDEDLIQGAELLLELTGRKIDSQKPITQVEDRIEIVLIPLGKVQARVINELRYQLQEKMGIKYSIYGETMDIGKIDRNQLDSYVESFYALVDKSLSPKGKDILLDELDLDSEDLELTKNKIQFVLAFFDKLGEDGQKARENFDKGFEEASSRGQYNTARLIPELKNKFPLKKGSPIKGYLAVTSDDIYEGEANFLFGGARPGYGVMSYRRFTAKFNDEDQNRPRLVERIAKQGISSSFFTLNIPRCSNPICVRAYPHSLDEHDQKKFELCNECKEKLSAYIKKHIAEVIYAR